jgi:hypothetical protein
MTRFRGWDCRFGRGQLVFASALQQGIAARLESKIPKRFEVEDWREAQGSPPVCGLVLSLSGWRRN